MLLGGLRYLLPIIETAHKLGIYVITVDYLPNNIAHKYSDEYHNVSIIDKDAILKLAKELAIDGIMSFAVDPGVATAAYVAEKMGIPFQGSYNSVKILQDKELVRQFLTENNFNCPHAKGYTKESNPLQDVDFFNWPVIVKPVDSAGSKGVSRVNDPSDLPRAVEIALEESHNGHYIIEDFLTFEGFHSSADCFTVDGELKFCTYSDQLFDKNAENPYTPAMIIWPTTMKQEHQDALTSDLQRLMKLLNMGTGIYNIETCVANGKPYIMEVSPRGGGCKIAEIQEMATNEKLIEAEVRKAVGMPLNPINAPAFNGVWCEMIIHADIKKEGIFKSLQIDSSIEEKYVKLIDLSVQPGDVVRPFTGANMALGDIFLRFDSRDELEQVMARKHEWMKVELA